jgi:hypothetical protein
LGSNLPITFSLDSCVSCRLYEDSRPHYLEVAQLQKGLVLLVDGNEVIEEGMGFGTPVVLYHDRPFFSSSAEVSFRPEGSHKVLIKSFTIDTVSRKKIGKDFYVNDRFYRFFQKPFHNIYTQNKKLAPILTRIIQLSKTFGVNTEFQKVNPKGIITVKYSCLPNLIEVEVTFSKLNKKECKEILILNEQGASFFRKYSDTEGLTLLDGQIGAWESTKSEEVSLSNIKETTGFSLRNKEGTTLFRGREKVRKRYSWVGFCYSLSPHISTFRYSVRLNTSAMRDQGRPNVCTKTHRLSDEPSV